MRVFINLIVLSLCCMALSSSAQVDPHFSQYYAYSLYLNPALTGISQVDFRATAIYRNQWSSYGKPYTSKGLSADFTTNSNINLGVNVLNQTAGNGGYSFTNAYVSVSYTGIKFDEDGYQRLSLGLQGGFISRKFDPEKLQFGSQWIPYVGYASTLPSGERFDKTTSTVFDANAGAAYYDGNPDKKVNVFAGISVAHLTEPEDPFLFGDKSKLPMRLTIHGGARIYVNEQVSVVPNFIFMQQGNAQEKMLGGYVEWNADRPVQLLAGFNYRLSDAIVPFAGIGFSDILIGLSYDANVSQMAKASGRADSFEISITFNKKQSHGNDYFKCPRF
jgi:type IX secretion system PorP/SprF family membrane protein